MPGISKLALLCLFLTGLALGQGRLNGRVLDETTGEPVGRLTIRLLGSGHSRTGITGPDGGVSIDGLIPGEYEVVFSRAGYGQAPSRGPLHLRISRGAPLVPVEWYVAARGSIRGTVRDFGGQPIPGAVVQLISRGNNEGTPCWQEVRRTYTDDRGEYAAENLAAGLYFVQAQGRYGRTGNWPWVFGVEGFRRSGEASQSALAHSYFPSVPAFEDATSISVGAVAHVTNIDITLAAQPVHQIRGQFINRLVFTDRLGFDFISATPLLSGSAADWDPHFGDLHKDGTFEINNVPNGRYLVELSHGRNQRVPQGRGFIVEVRGSDVVAAALADTHDEAQIAGCRAIVGGED